MLKNYFPEENNLVMNVKRILTFCKV